MSSVVLSVISILMLVMVLSAGISFINFNTLYEVRQAGQIQHGFLQLTTGYLTFQELHGEDPSLLEDIVPSIILLPELPEGLAWSYDEANNNWFCVSGVVEDKSLLGMRKAAADLRGPSSILASECGATTNDPQDVFPGLSAITYHVRIP